MLVLARLPHKRIFIGDDIVVTIVGVRDDHVVRIGIEAPIGLAIDREEVRESKIKTGFYPPTHLTAAGIGVEELLKKDGQIT